MIGCKMATVPTTVQILINTIIDKGCILLAKDALNIRPLPYHLPFDIWHQLGITSFILSFQLIKQTFVSILRYLDAILHPKHFLKHIGRILILNTDNIALRMQWILRLALDHRILARISRNLHLLQLLLFTQLIKLLLPEHLLNIQLIFNLHQKVICNILHLLNLVFRYLFLLFVYFVHIDENLTGLLLTGHVVYHLHISHDLPILNAIRNVTDLVCAYELWRMNLVIVHLNITHLIRSFWLLYTIKSIPALKRVVIRPSNIIFTAILLPQNNILSLNLINLLKLFLEFGNILHFRIGAIWQHRYYLLIDITIIKLWKFNIKAKTLCFVAWVLARQIHNVHVRLFKKEEADWFYEFHLNT